MKTRTAGYDDYGFEPGEEERLKKICRQPDAITFYMVCVAAKKAHPGISLHLAHSLVNSLSYEKISYAQEIPISKGDFYANRRKCLYLLKKIAEVKELKK